MCFILDIDSRELRRKYLQSLCTEVRLLSFDPSVLLFGHTTVAVVVPVEVKGELELLRRELSLPNIRLVVGVVFKDWYFGKRRKGPRGA